MEEILSGLKSKIKKSKLVTGIIGGFQGIVLAGNPAKIVKENINWKFERI